MPAVSIIIPTYNRKDFIPECLKSIAEQTFRDFELIIIDDGSTDQSGQILQNVSNLKYTLVRQRHQGPSAARNTGIRLAGAEWLSFLDSDDLWLPQKLQQQMAFIEKNPEAKVCYTEEIWYRKGRRVNPKKIQKKYSGWIYPRLLPLCIVSPSSVIIHRSVFEKVGRFDESLPACEDYDLWLRMGIHFPFYLMNTPLIIKRNGHPNQQSAKYWGMDRFRIKALQKMLNSGKLSPHDHNATVAVMKKKCEIVALGCEKRGKLDEALYYRNLIKDYNNQIHH